MRITFVFVIIIRKKYLYMVAFFKKIPLALSKTRTMLSQGLTQLLGKGIDKCSIEEVEALLYKADLGTAFVQSCIALLSKTYKPSAEKILEIIKERALENLPPTHTPQSAQSPITLFIGSNGSGKTTSIAKLARWHKQQGTEVVIVAADTFRAAAQDQLEIHAQSLDIPIVKGGHKKDPSSVIYEALSQSKEEHFLIDTAGRLEGKIGLLEELKKMHRVCEKLRPHSTVTVLFTIDATCGQHVMEQLSAFDKALPISGLVITKLDTSSRGGVLIPLYQQLKIPVHWIGTGEHFEDWEPYHKDSFCQGLFPS